MSPMPPPTAYKPGTELTVGSHKVTIKKYISQGGFAHVYTCDISPPWNNMTVACLKRVAVADKPTLNILRQEVDAMRKLEGKSCIVSYIDSHASRINTNVHDQNGNNIIHNSQGYEVFLLMEYCSKNGLIDFMNTRLVNKLTEPEILQIMGEITEGVAHMHALNPPLIHKDIKIENVLISADFHYKLCDFGSASPSLRPPKNVEEFQVLQDDIMKHTTPQYRCPEMIDLYRRLPINEKSDIWALGVFLYKLCYYTTPFENNSINGNGNAGGGEYAILNGLFSFPNQPVYSSRLKNMISKCLAVNPDLRPNVFQLLEEICKMRNMPFPATIKQEQQAQKQQLTANSMPSNAPQNSLPLSNSSSVLSTFTSTPNPGKSGEEKPALPTRRNKIDAPAHTLTTSKSGNYEKFTSQPNQYNKNGKPDPFLGIEKGNSFHHNKSSNDIASVNNINGPNSTNPYLQTVSFTSVPNNGNSNGKFADPSQFIPTRNIVGSSSNPASYRIRSPNFVPTSETTSNFKMLNSRPISMSAAEFNNLQPINSQASGSKMHNIMSEIHKEETIQLSPVGKNTEQKTGDRKGRVRSGGHNTHSKRSSISSLKDLLTGNRTGSSISGSRQREHSRGPPSRHYTGSNSNPNSRNPSASFTMMNSSTESLTEIHRISSIDSTGSTNSSIINGYAYPERKSRDFSNESIGNGANNSSTTLVANDPKVPPSRPPKRSNSIQRRVQMLLNRKQSPPPTKTASGYGKYTKSTDSDEEEDGQGRSNYEEERPTSSSYLLSHISRSKSLHSKSKSISNNGFSDEQKDRDIMPPPVMPRRPQTQTPRISSSEKSTPPPVNRHKKVPIESTPSPTLSSVSSYSTTTNSTSSPGTGRLLTKEAIKTALVNKKPPPPRPKKPAFLRSPHSKNQLKLPTSDDESITGSSISNRRLSGMSDFDDIEDLEKRFNEKFPSAL